MNWKTTHLAQDGTKSINDLATAYARARGCATDEQVAQFMAVEPDLPNPLIVMPGWDAATDRVARAIRNSEAVSVFGDYDVDGVTSVSIMVDLFRSYNHEKVRVYLPDRMVDGYGLTPDAVSKCIEEQKPNILIVVDCGSNSHAVLAEVQAKGIDAIILDHHSVLPSPETGHPSFAHLNPKAHPELTSQHAREMSAAGLAFFFAEGVAKATGNEIKWRRDRALLLGGLGTHCDVMPLTGINRALVKCSLTRANDRHIISQIPGLQSLGAVAGVNICTSFDYGFKIGPRLNASGRLTHAKNSLRLLCVTENIKSVQIAKELDEINRERKELQDRILEKACEMVENSLAIFPDEKVIFVHDEEWHPGVIGIVAGRIRERFGRPTIVAGRNPTDGAWKGSGRSVPGVDLGAIVTRAVKEGIISAGGGHAAACGVTMKGDEPQKFAVWFSDQGKTLSYDLTPNYEVIANLDSCPDTTALADLMQILAPFGNANPEPAIAGENLLIDRVEESTRRSDGEVWALKATLRARSGKTVTAIWTDLERGRELLIVGRRITAVLRFSREFRKGATYDTWKIVDAKNEEVAVQAA